jgi:hypothetical protein
MAMTHCASQQAGVAEDRTTYEMGLKDGRINGK